MKLPLILVSASALSITAPCRAEDRVIQAVWVILPQPTPAREVDAAGGDFILKQRLMPIGLTELTEVLEAPDGWGTLSKGTQLVEVQSQGAKVFCTSEIRPYAFTRKNQLCLVDSDNDAKFDGYFEIVSDTKGLMTFNGLRPKTPKSLSGIGYNRISPLQFKENISSASNDEISSIFIAWRTSVLRLAIANRSNA